MVTPDLWTLVFVLLPIMSIGEEIHKDDVFRDADYQYERQHSLSQPYWGHGWMIPNWDFLGTTVVTNDYIRLTSDSKSQEGALWNSVPVDLVNWEVMLEFKIHGHGTELAGDGLVFWYAKERMQFGPVFGSKDLFHGLAIVIDTYGNLVTAPSHDYPYISIMVNNGTLHYDHDGDGSLHEIGGCEIKARNLNQRTFLIVHYEKDVLTVFTDTQENDMWEKCAEINGVILPTKYFFGVSAATGDLSDNHDIISIVSHGVNLPAPNHPDTISRAFVTPSVAPSLNDPGQVKEEYKSKRGSSWGTTIFMGVVILGAVGGVVVIGFMIYKQYSQKSSKRFY